MSDGYIINSMEKSPDWIIEPKKLVEKLNHRWHGIKVKESEVYVLRWLIEIQGNHPILGGLQSDYHTVTIDGGPLAAIAEFAIWYRNLVPEKYPLFLYKGSTFDKPIKLLRATSKDMLITTLTNY